MQLGHRTIPVESRWIRGFIRIPIVRADLRNAERIRSLMADDMRGHLAAAGGVTHDDLVLIGWTAAQIAEHARDAIALARSRAGADQ